jgi:peptidoglycan/LPS O-acetylase OafA/YrhL
MTKHRHPFLHRHSLSLSSAAILVLWIVLYRASNPNTHLGAFYGNAIADWTGLVVMVLATKFLYERGSAESRKPKALLPPGLHEFLHDHSLTIFLLITGIGWIIWYVRVDPQGKWGQVIGNIVSEWTQILGLVVLTKRLIEKGSKESRQRS